MDKHFKKIIEIKNGHLKEKNGVQCPNECWCNDINEIEEFYKTTSNPNEDFKKMESPSLKIQKLKDFQLDLFLNTDIVFGAQ